MSSAVEVVALGGLGEFGMNCTAIRSGEDILLIDAGMAFPRGDKGADLGVQVIIPDFSYLAAHRENLRGVILTHGHEDHVGAVSFLVEEFDVPIYGNPLTLGLVRSKLRERGLIDRVRLYEIKARDRLDFGNLQVEALHVTHSFPDSFTLAVTTPIGVLIWSGDFKFDQTPVDGKISDIHRLAAYGEQGVLALFADSTNSEAAGLSPSENSIIEPLRNLFRLATGRIVASTFSSSIHRIQIVLDLAREFNRHVVTAGRSMVNNIQIAADLGYLKVPPDLLITSGSASVLPPDSVIVLASGSQGEPMSAMSRLAIGQFKGINIEEGDIVILSSRIIPGNEKSILRMVNHFYRRGARVFDTSRARVHASGHGYVDDLKFMINLTQPRFFIPIHGEYRQLKSHTRIAREQGIDADRIQLIENGDLLSLTPESIRLCGQIPVGRRFIDDGFLEEVHEVVLRERRFMSEDGFVMVILRMDRLTGSLIGEPELVSRGFVLLEESEELVQLARRRVVEVIEETTVEERQDGELFNEILRKELKRLFRKQTGKTIEI